jgi:hypothetical protein
MKKKRGGGTVSLAEVMPGRACGERIASSKLTVKDVVQIRSLFERGGGIRAIARVFGVTPAAVRGIVRGTTWKHVPDEAAPARS